MKNVIVIAAHKACPVPDDPLYLPVFAGAHGRADIGFQRDDEGENISALNSRYGELTCLYWAWKNTEYDNLGLVHYRRYFSLHPRKAKKDFFAAVLTSEEAQALTERYGIILPKKRHYYIETIRSHYTHTFHGEHLGAAEDAVREICPEYLPDFRDLMERRSAYMYNMMIMRSNIADAYCEWLFGLLPHIAERIDDSGYSDFHRRWTGRTAERLLNVWLIHQLRTGVIKEDEIKEIPCIHDGSVNWPKKITAFLMAKLFGRKYEESF